MGGGGQLVLAVRCVCLQIIIIIIITITILYRNIIWMKIPSGNQAGHIYPILVLIKIALLGQRF